MYCGYSETMTSHALGGLAGSRHLSPGRLSLTQQAQEEEQDEYRRGISS